MQRILRIFTLGLFLLSHGLSYAQSTAAFYDAPSSGRLFASGVAHDVPVLSGVRFDQRNPFRLEFFLTKSGISKKDIQRQISYFFACLTLAEDKLWVNLSPYEENRIAQDDLAITNLGCDMLAQDYLLKQTASGLTHPDTPQGKKYWSQINGLQPGALKVWITSDKPVVVEYGLSASIESAKLKVLLDQDNPAFKENILPLVEEAVNNDDNFITIRQVYRAFILASWFKKKLKDSVYNSYFDQAKVSGIAIEDKHVKEKVYRSYLDLFANGAYNIVKKERLKNKSITRKYFSGGVNLKSDDLITRPGDKEPSGPKAIAAVTADGARLDKSAPTVDAALTLDNIGSVTALKDYIIAHAHQHAEALGKHGFYNGTNGVLSGKDGSPTTGNDFLRLISAYFSPIVDKVELYRLKGQIIAACAQTPGLEGIGRVLDELRQSSVQSTSSWGLYYAMDEAIPSNSNGFARFRDRYKGEALEGLTSLQERLLINLEKNNDISGISICLARIARQPPSMSNKAKWFQTNMALLREKLAALKVKLKNPVPGALKVINAGDPEVEHQRAVIAARFRAQAREQLEQTLPMASLGHLALHDRFLPWAINISLDYLPWQKDNSVEMPDCVRAIMHYGRIKSLVGAQSGQDYIETLPVLHEQETPEVKVEQIFHERVELEAFVILMNDYSKRTGKNVTDITQKEIEAVSLRAHKVAWAITVRYFGINLNEGKYTITPEQVRQIEIMVENGDRGSIQALIDEYPQRARMSRTDSIVADLKILGLIENNATAIVADHRINEILFLRGLVQARDAMEKRNSKQFVDVSDTMLLNNTSIIEQAFEAAARYARRKVNSEDRTFQVFEGSADHESVFPSSMSPVRRSEILSLFIEPGSFSMPRITPVQRMAMDTPVDLPNMASPKVPDFGHILSSLHPASRYISPKSEYALPLPRIPDANNTPAGHDTDIDELTPVDEFTPADNDVIPRLMTDIDTSESRLTSKDQVLLSKIKTIIMRDIKNGIIRLGREQLVSESFVYHSKNGDGLWERHTANVHDNVRVARINWGKYAIPEKVRSFSLEDPTGTTVIILPQGLSEAEEFIRIRHEMIEGELVQSLYRDYTRHIGSDQDPIKNIPDFIAHKAARDAHFLSYAIIAVKYGVTALEFMGQLRNIMQDDARRNRLYKEGESARAYHHNVIEYWLGPYVLAEVKKAERQFRRIVRNGFNGAPRLGAIARSSRGNHDALGGIELDASSTQYRGTTSSLIDISSKNAEIFKRSKNISFEIIATR